ncbi:hypothetical protein N431DRAFT_499246 [Stipitochalara longipes BDJ]|nr:hypothetical protein N431DRAFT_499246 [Stipitochalara longipes BDJ]
MSEAGTDASGRRQRRAPMACDFCRRRKIKCNNEKPKCRNCLDNGKNCLYIELIKKLSNIGPCRSRPSYQQSLQLLTPTSLSSSTPIGQKTFSPDKESCYHGPTRSVFDENLSERAIRQNISISAQLSEISVNLLAGNLDFDEVDPELGMHLLSIYWNRQLLSGPVVYRTVFMRDMACSGPYFSRLLLNAIYFYACKYSPRLEVRQDPNNCLTAGFKFRRRAAEILSQSFDKSNITTIQALLIMSSAIFSWCDEKSVSWLYAGMAFNMIIDLGIHVDASTLKRTFSDEELEVRRRVFWAAYGTKLSLSFLDEYEELELFNPLSFNEQLTSPISPGHSISCFTETCKLSTILERIFMSLYTEAGGSRDPNALLRESDSLHQELKNWRKSLPSHLDLLSSDTGTRVSMSHTLALLAMYNVLVILLHRPFVSDGHLHSTTLYAAREAFSKCSAAAFEVDRILQAYEQAFCLKATPYIISYATYVSATIHARLAAQGYRGDDAHTALQRCLNVLDIHQTVCWSSRRAKRVIDGLIARMGVVFSSGESQSQPSDLIFSDFDIDEIIRTFALEQQTSRSPNQHLHTANDGFVIAKSPPIQLGNTSSNNNDQGGDHTISWTGEEIGLSYEPIYGFSGSAFDDLDDLDDLDFGIEDGLVGKGYI